MAGEETATPITVTGTIQAVDPETRTATIAHGPIVEIGMPGTTKDFAVAENLGLDALPMDQDAMLTFERPDGMTMVLAAFEVAAPPMRVDGTINSVDAAARTANITHGPMAQIGMPGMTMDFLIDDSVDLASLKPGEDHILELRQNPDFSMTLVGVLPPPIEATGRINSVDPQTRVANVSHGPIAAIGMPGMTMDFALDEALDVASLPLEAEVTLHLRQNEDFSMTLVGADAAEVTQ
jgi:Cu(I)/Ag(I) efflux system membrane fusion protein